jgi:hypothetical protein
VCFESRYLRVGLAPSALRSVVAALSGAFGIVAVAIGLRCPYYALAGATISDLSEVLRSTPVGQDLLTAFSRYLDRYGHQVYNLDFVAPIQADAPLPVLLSLKAIVVRPGHDPCSRQRAIVAERDKLVALMGACTTWSVGSLRAMLGHYAGSSLPLPQAKAPSMVAWGS